MKFLSFFFPLLTNDKGDVRFPHMWYIIRAFLQTLPLLRSLPAPSPIHTPSSRGRELERLLEDASRRTEAEHDRGTTLQEEVSSLCEEIAKAEQEWKR